MKNKGKRKFGYAFADFPGGVCIWDVESNEELQHILFLLPSMPLVKRTVRLLTEMKSVSEISPNWNPCQFYAKTKLKLKL